MLAGVGTHTVTYIFEDENGCTGFATATITVIESLIVSLPEYEDVCEDSGAFALYGGYPEGGIYEGEGVTDGWFDPAVAGIGTHTITYFVTDDYGCEGFAETTITVNELPLVSLEDLGEYCHDTPRNRT